jgi:hypothetical protein
MVTLICMVGNDYQRIIDGVNYWREKEPIEALYLFFDKKRDKYGFSSKRNAEDLRENLTSRRLHPATVGYNPQSYEDVFCAFYRVLSREVEIYSREVFVDTTSTTKEAYGATVTIALMFRNVRIYIVPPRERGWYVPSPEDPAFQQWFARTRSVRGMMPQEIYLPGQRLDRPEGEERRVLLLLAAHGGSSDTLASIIRWCDLDDADPVVKNRYSRIVRRLERKGFVDKRRRSRGVEVVLTRFGRIFAEAMKEARR